MNADLLYANQLCLVASWCVVYALMMSALSVYPGDWILLTSALALWVEVGTWHVLDLALCVFGRVINGTTTAHLPSVSLSLIRDGKKAAEIFGLTTLFSSSGRFLYDLTLQLFRQVSGYWSVEQYGVSCLAQGPCSCG